MNYSLFRKQIDIKSEWEIRCTLVQQNKKYRIPKK